MTPRPLATLTLIGVTALAAAGTVLAQAPVDTSSTPAATPATPAAKAPESTPTPAASQTPATSPTPTAAPASAPATPGAPSADTLKKARLAGYRPETKNGVTRYCQETANLGTRFPTKKCLDEQQLAGVLDIQNQNKDSLMKPGMCAGAGCAGH